MESLRELSFGNPCCYLCLRYSVTQSGGGVKEKILILCAFYHHSVPGMIHFMSKYRGWDRPSIELPPGWHALLQELSDVTGVKLKYLYTLAVEQLLANINVQRVSNKAWKIQREAGEDLDGVGERHTADTLRKLKAYKELKAAAERTES